jgi:hypothetical protein
MRGANAMTTEELEQLVDQVVDDLHRSLPDTASEDVDSVAQHYSRRLACDATVHEFIPLLVERYKKEHFRAARDELHESA